MLPVVSKVIGVEKPVTWLLQYLVETNFGLHRPFLTRLHDVFVQVACGQWITSTLARHKIIKMGVGPAKGDLDDRVERVEMELRRNLQDGAR